MSKLSPYRRARKESSPNELLQHNRLADNCRTGKSYIVESPSRCGQKEHTRCTDKEFIRYGDKERYDRDILRYNQKEQRDIKYADKDLRENKYKDKQYYEKDISRYPSKDLVRHTQKKKHDPIDIQGIIDKNQQLTIENTQLYSMLEERGHIVATLEHKLKEQIEREVTTLQEIQYEKNIFIKDQQKKNKQYQKNIDKLQTEVSHLEAQKTILSKDVEKAYAVASQRAYTIAEHSMKGADEKERAKVRNIIQIKSQQFAQIQAQYINHIDLLKHQIENANNQIHHLTHQYNIKDTETRIYFQNTIQSMERQFAVQKETLIYQYNADMEKLISQLQNKEVQLQKMSDDIRVICGQHNIRQKELAEHKLKIENEIIALDSHHKQNAFQQTQKLKDLNKCEVMLLQQSNAAKLSLISNNKAMLQQLLVSKTDQIDRLYKQIESVRNTHNDQIFQKNNLIQSLRHQIQVREHEFQCEQQALKIKIATLRSADLNALKQYYEHQILSLTKNIIDLQSTVKQSRKELYFEIQEKKNNRKQFDIEVTNLNAKIVELEVRLSTILSEKKENVSQALVQNEMISVALFRETNQKEKYIISNEEEKKQLQELIQAKNKEIQKLNDKIKLIKDNHKKQTDDKNSQIQLIAKTKQGLEIQLKKQKYFYQNESQKKDSSFKLMKERFQKQIQQLKKINEEKYELISKEFSTIKNALDIEINSRQAIQKKLKNDIFLIKQHKKQQKEDSQKTLEQEKIRLKSESINNETKLHNYYKSQIAKLSIQIKDQQKLLSSKEEEIRQAQIKYRRLEDKFATLIESQQKLKNLETKVLSMGQQNNIVKNLGDLMRSKKN